MRRTLFFILIIVCFYNVKAQKQLLIDEVYGESQINIALNEVNKIYIPPKMDAILLKSAETGCFNVTYENFPEDAKAAFQYALDIWESVISSPVKINVVAKWESMSSSILAYGKPAVYYKNFTGAGYTNVYYPVALAEKLAAKEMNGSSEPDIICFFNKDISWYFGTDGNTPSSKYDFTTAALHEITHGLGFSGFFSVEEGSGLINNSNELPSIYDFYIFNKSNQRIADNTVFARPSAELYHQLTSESLRFVGSDEKSASTDEFPYVYAPENWKEGSSLYHLDYSSVGSDDDNSLMTAYKFKGQAVHTPGESTIEMLSEMGWKTISFNFEPLKDLEETCQQIKVSLGINSEVAFDSSSIKIIYSNSYFTTKDSFPLTYNSSTNLFTGNLPVNYQLGNIQYYIVAKSTENKIYSLPSNAPTKKLTFRIGPDYAPPTVSHNPVKIISKQLKSMHLEATATDDLGVNSVKVEMKINGIVQEPVVLNPGSNNIFSSDIYIDEQLLNYDSVEYRIIADDISKSNNKIIVPASGYYSAKVFDAVEPVNSYENDFNTNTEDFITADFEISEVSGFSSGILHTSNPYTQSAFENEKYNLIAQLKTPVIIEDFGQMSFKEVVLVEPGENDADYTETLFWDYVIVEASKDSGKTWLPLTSGYDSNTDKTWYSCFANSINNKSAMIGNESMFLEHIINLTDNTELVAGDTVIFRFRLASDQSINGWGWAIDDLKIQKTFATPEEEIASVQNFNVYPNPFANNFYVDCSGSDEVSDMEILVTDLAGKTIFTEIWTDVQYNQKKQINLNNIQPGIYLVNMITDAPERITKKIVKY